MSKFHHPRPPLLISLFILLFSGVFLRADSSQYFEGVIQVVIHDDVDGKSYQYDFLDMGDDRWMKLIYPSEDSRKMHLADRSELPVFPGAGPVRIYGSQVNGEIEVKQMELSGSAISKTVSSQALNMSGKRTVAVVLVSFPGIPSPYDPEQMREAIFDTTGRTSNAFYKECSRDKFWIEGIENVNGDVFGPVEINTNGCTEMNYSSISTAARDAVAATGIDIDAYNYVVHYFPSAPECPGGGIGGGKYVTIFGVGINGSWDYVAHELSHCFGLGHSSSYDNCTSIDGSTISHGGDCTHNEYGDQTDIMGGRNFIYSSYYLERLGWLEQNNILVLQSSARVPLVPIETASDGIQSLRVPRGDGTFWHFEYRQPLGSDSRLETGLTNGVLVRIVPNPDSRGNPHILDMNPGTTHFRDAALGEGIEFIGDDGEIKVTTVDVTADSVVIEVIIGGEPVALWQKVSENSRDKYITIPFNGHGKMIYLPINASGNVKTIEVVDPRGRIVDKLSIGDARKGRPVNIKTPGVYLLRYDTGGNTRCLIF